jgi:hypothetical protein
MTKAELEDLIKLHNAELEEEYSTLYEQWRALRFEESTDSERLKNLRKQMDHARNEKIELKGEA